MQFRYAVALTLAALLPGCAGEGPIAMPLASPALASQALASQALSSPQSHYNPSATAAALQGQAPDEMYRKTLASKVLAALALERVTGRKPDPAHFANAN